MFGTPGIAQLLIVGLIVLLLFGNRLPSVMRSLGEGITEFKKGIRSEGPSDASHQIEDRQEYDSIRGETTSSKTSEVREPQESTP